MTNQTNPWTLARLNDYLGQDEHTNLEFKSCKGFLSNKDFFIKNLVAEVSAFLNTDGGILIIGIEEIQSQDNPKTKIAGNIEGVDRGIMTANQLSQSIHAKISPTPGALIQVFPVNLNNDGVEKFAFVIEVKCGRTAYQSSPDKIYYGRRGSECIPLDDKDVRLRMVGDDRPRVDLKFVSDLLVPGGWSGYEENFFLKRESESRLQERKLADEKLSDSEKEKRAAEFASSLQNKTSTFKLNGNFVSTPKRIEKALVVINIFVCNSGSSKIDKLCMSFSQRDLFSMEWTVSHKVRTTTCGEQIYIESDFMYSDGVPLYPGMTTDLLCFSFELKRDTALPRFSDILDFSIYLDGGIGTYISVPLDRIMKENALEFVQKATEIESKFPEITPERWPS